MSGVPLVLGDASPSTFRVLWLLDVAAWLVTVVCGFLVVGGHSTSVEYVLSGSPWLVGAFATMWIVGGLAGLVTRLLRLGIAEVPAITSTLTALVVYEVLLGYAIAHGFPFGLMPGVLLLVIIALAARWVVLHDLGRKHPHRHDREG